MSMAHLVSQRRGVADPPNQLRLAILTNWYPPHIGGSAISVHMICREHVKRHKVTVLTPKRDQGPDEEEVDGVVVKRFRNWHNRARLYPDTNTRTLCPGLFWEVLKGRYDLVIAYPSLTPNFRLCLSASLLNRTPVILTVFDLLDYRNFALGKFPDRDLLDDFYRRKNLPKRWLFRWQLACCKGILGIGKTEVGFLRRFNPSAVLTPVHIDLNEFGEIQGGRFKARFSLMGRKIVLSVGRIEPHKGQDILLQAVPSILQQEPAAHFVFAGPVDDKSYFDALLEKVRKLGVTGKILFTGPLDRNSLLEAFCDCDLHVAPVRFMNSGSVTQEAWAARKPAIQSNRVDPNHIEDGVNGYTFDIDNPSSLVEKVLCLLADEDLRIRLGENGRRKVEDQFDYKEGVYRLEGQYHDFLNGGNGAGATPK